MWLKVNYITRDVVKSELNPQNISISLINSASVPINSEDHFVRISKVFPLDDRAVNPINIDNCTIHFFDYENPYRILGKLEQHGSEELNRCVFFPMGLVLLSYFATIKK